MSQDRLPDVRRKRMGSSQKGTTPEEKVKRKRVRETFESFIMDYSSLSSLSGIVELPAHIFDERKTKLSPTDRVRVTVELIQPRRRRP